MTHNNGNDVFNFKHRNRHEHGSRRPAWFVKNSEPMNNIHRSAAKLKPVNGFDVLAERSIYTVHIYCIFSIYVYCICTPLAKTLKQVAGLNVVVDRCNSKKK